MWHPASCLPPWSHASWCFLNLKYFDFPYCLNDHHRCRTQKQRNVLLWHLCYLRTRPHYHLLSLHCWLTLIFPYPSLNFLELGASHCIAWDFVVLEALCNASHHDPAYHIESKRLEAFHIWSLPRIFLLQHLQPYPLFWGACLIGDPL